MEWIKRVLRFEKTAEGVHGFITSELVKPWLLPLGGAALTLLSGLLSAVPLPYLITSAFLTAAAISALLLRLDEWWERTNPSGKVIFEHPIFGIDVNPNTQPHRLNNIQLGFVFRNNANFPMRYEIVDIDTQFMGRVAREKIYSNKGGEVPSKSTEWFRDYPIQIKSDIPENGEEGRIKFKIAYWKSPKRKFYVERSIRVSARFDTRSRQAGFDWLYE